MADPVSDADSVLNSVKKALGIEAAYDVFDLEIIMHINTALSTLWQLGVGLTDEQPIVEDANTTWDQVLTSQKNIVMVKSYIYLRVKLLFDPPATGFTTDSYAKQIQELEWRLTVATSSSPNVPTT